PTKRMTPIWSGASSSASRTAGSREAQLAKVAPLSRKTAKTLAAARRTRRVSTVVGIGPRGSRTGRPGSRRPRAANRFDDRRTPYVRLVRPTKGAWCAAPPHNSDGRRASGGRVAVDGLPRLLGRLADLRRHPGQGARRRGRARLPRPQPGG